MPFIPFAATVGAMLGASATAGGIAIAGTAAAIAGAATSQYQSSVATTQQKKSTGNQRATLESEAAKQEAALRKAAADAEAAPGLAAQAAQEAIKKRRRTSLLSGGDTDITGDTLGSPGADNLQIKSLIGG